MLWEVGMLYLFCPDFRVTSGRCGLRIAPINYQVAHCLMLRSYGDLSVWGVLFYAYIQFPSPWGFCIAFAREKRLELDKHSVLNRFLRVADHPLIRGWIFLWSFMLNTRSRCFSILERFNAIFSSPIGRHLLGLCKNSWHLFAWIQAALTNWLREMRDRAVGCLGVWVFVPNFLHPFSVTHALLWKYSNFFALYCPNNLVLKLLS